MSENLLDVKRIMVYLLYLSCASSFFTYHSYTLLLCVSKWLLSRFPCLESRKEGGRAIVPSRCSTMVSVTPSLPTSTVPFKAP